jgi:hypothetical protein
MTLREKPEAVKSRAYLVYVEWGPNMSLPRHERLATEFPLDARELLRAARRNALGVRLA